MLIDETIEPDFGRLGVFASCTFYLSGMGTIWTENDLHFTTSCLIVFQVR